MSEEEKIKGASLLSQWFDVVDTNGDGVISPLEFGVYFKIMGIDESSTQASFDAIDTNHDGLISRDEFVAAGVDFFVGVDETSGGTLFWGPLVDFILLCSSILNNINNNHVCHYFYCIISLDHLS